jgi:hypothetical protein
VSIVPSSTPAAPAVTTAFTQSVQSGLDVVVSRKLLKPGDPLYTKVQSFIQYTQQGKTQIEAEQLAGVSPVLVSKLSTLGTSSTAPTLASAPIPQPQAPSLEKETEKDASPAVASVPVVTQPNSQTQKPKEEPKSELNEKPPLAKLDSALSKQPIESTDYVKRGSPRQILAKIQIPLEDGTSVTADKLLDIQSRVWTLKKGAYRKTFGYFLNALVNSDKPPEARLEDALKRTGDAFTLNDARWLAAIAVQKPSAETSSIQGVSP